MLNETCNNEIVKDCIFFMQRKDFPIMTKNYIEAYEHIYNNNKMKQPYLSYKYIHEIPFKSCYL